MPRRRSERVYRERNMRTVASLVLATFMISLTSGASSAQTAKEWEDVIAAAKREGQIVVYTAYISKNTHDPIAKAFEKKYGIQVSYLAARGGEIRERVRSEQTA